MKVLIISDIYFSAAQLRDILRLRGFDADRFAAVLTSSDENVCKGTGNLFRRALKGLHLEPEQMIHVGDNFLADVTGARKAGVRGCHYPQAAAGTRTILERERFLLAGQTPVFSINSLRLLAARLFPGDTAEGFFSRTGAFLMGPVLTRYAGWACEQFTAGGVRKVGALMREGELFGELLQREARVRGLDLEITPLYVNRRATDLAAIGQLTANNLIAWLEARPTLSVKAILTQFGLEVADFRHRRWRWTKRRTPRTKFSGWRSSCSPRKLRGALKPSAPKNGARCWIISARGSQAANRSVCATSATAPRRRRS